MPDSWVLCFVLFYNCNDNFLATAYQERGVGLVVWVLILLNTHLFLVFLI